MISAQFAVGLTSGTLGRILTHEKKMGVLDHYSVLYVQVTNLYSIFNKAICYSLYVKVVLFMFHLQRVTRAAGKLRSAFCVSTFRFVQGNGYTV